ncbi:MAG TPA: ATP-binding protein [Phycisphaerae bacterium]|nr:ATP-binding protein [Phycisphaerae bacterium]
MKRLRNRLLIRFLLVGLIPIAVGTIVAVVITGREMDAALAGRLADDSVGLRTQVEHISDELLAGTSALVADQGFREVLQRGDRQALLATLQRARGVMGIDLITLADAKGTVLARGHAPARYGDRLAETPALARALAGERTAGAMRGEAGMGVGVVQPIVSEGAVAWILRAEKLLDYRFAAQIAGTYGVDVTVMDGDRLQTTTFTDASVLRAGLADRPRGPRDAETGRIRIVAAGGTHYSLAATDILPVGGESDGIVLVGVSHRQFHRDLTLLALRHGAVAAALMAGLVVVCLRVASNIVRPIRQLSEAAEAAAAGDLNSSIRVQSDDEIGDLAGRFSHMVAARKQAEAEVARHRDRLEDLVAERTEELAGSNRQLHREMADRVRAEEELTEAFERFRTVMDSIDAIVCVSALDTNEILFINRHCREVFGDVVGMSLLEGLLFLGANPDTRCDPKRLVDDQGRPTGVCLCELQNPADEKWYECRAQAINWIDGRQVRLEFAADVTYRKEADRRQARLEEQLRQAQKMEAIGQLAGGVAHDFNNLLTGILGNAQLLDMELERNSDEWGYAAEIVRAATRAADLTRQLLAFSRKGPIQTIPVDVHEVIAEVAKLLSHSIDRRIELVQDLQARPSCVMGDPTQIQNAILNLAVNARDAMPEGGELRFATRVVVLDQDYCAMRAGQVHPGPHVEIAVCDTGVGMDAKLQQRIFEPFFTTKSAGKGTGLGLASVYGCVRSHAGAIDVYSELGRGSTFKVLLPLAETEAGPPSPQAGRPIKGAGNILLVDDEDVVRNFTARALRGLGYTVTPAADGVEAVEVFGEAEGHFDAVVLDLIMPKLGGEDAFRLMKEIDPNVRVLVATGFSQPGVIDSLLRQGVVAVLIKPFSIENLSREIARVIPVKAG